MATAKNITLALLAVFGGLFRTAAAAGASFRGPADGLRVAAPLPLCDNGFVHCLNGKAYTDTTFGTPLNESCKDACGGDCCDGGQACDKGRFSVCRDGSCEGDFACFKAGADGEIGDIVRSCNARHACYHAGGNGGRVGNIIDSCNAQKACYLAGRGISADVDNLTSCCNSIDECRQVSTQPAACAAPASSPFDEEIKEKIESIKESMAKIEEGMVEMKGEMKDEMKKEIQKAIEQSNEAMKGEMKKEIQEAIAASNTATTCVSDIKVVLKTDHYPNESSWDLRDKCDGGKVIKEASDFTDKETEYQQDFCSTTEFGKYSATVRDTYGDGIVGDNSFTVQIGTESRAAQFNDGYCNRLTWGACSNEETNIDFDSAEWVVCSHNSSNDSADMVSPM